MKQMIPLTAAVLLSLCLSTQALAYNFGIDITISDANHAAGTSWYGDHEDQEVEPGMLANQHWDLEGFFLDRTNLTLIGGYDFLNGQDGIFPGDIFLDIDHDAVFGDIHGAQNGNRTVKNSFGYDYALDLDFEDLTFVAYAIDDTAMVETAFYKQNQGSSPWRYVSGGTLVTPEPIGIVYRSGLADGDTGLLGGFHNAVTLDLSFLNDLHHGTHFISHFTMGCGNDNLMGEGALPAPEPATILLIGCGLLGFASIVRRKVPRKQPVPKE
jgi:hypothetical protein